MVVNLVEDNPDMLESMKLLLELRGYRVRTYLRALDLLDDAARLRPGDCVVSDYFLPDMNGVELLKRLAADLPALQCVLLTGSREYHIERAARSVPNCKVVYKPVDYESLASLLRLPRNGPLRQADGR